MLINNTSRALMVSAPSKSPLEKVSKENANVKKNLRKDITNMLKEGTSKQIRTTEVLGRLYLTSRIRAHR